jgi:hypothetical protein
MNPNDPRVETTPTPAFAFLPATGRVAAPGAAGRRAVAFF